MRLCLVGFIVLASCVTGRTPPEPTKLVRVEGGLFMFGEGDHQCYQNDELELTDCTKDQKLEKTYPAVLVDIKPFAIEEHEVTNLQYEYCVLLGKCDEPVAFAVGIQEQYFGNPTYHDYPVLNVSYRMAEQYCHFIGRRLPYEWEWERVAAGPALKVEDKRLYALRGSKDDPKAYTSIRNCEGLDVALRACNGEERPRPVKASKDDVVYEGDQPIYDLTGNVAEYVAGFYKADVTCLRPLQGCQDCWDCDKLPASEIQTCKEDCYTQCADCDNNGPACFKTCKNPICIQNTDNQPQDLWVGEGKYRLARGGTYRDQKNQTCFARTTDRHRTVETDDQGKAASIGFRCAVDQ